MKYFGTLGPACANRETLVRMIEEGMTGIRLNVSHGCLEDRKEWIMELHQAEEEVHRKIEVIVDLQGPELRIGELVEPMELREGQLVVFTVEKSLEGEISVPKEIIQHMYPGSELLLDDGNIQICATEDEKTGIVSKGGLLNSFKSVAIEGMKMTGPTLTDQDRRTLSLCREYGVTGIMQPFVRNSLDLIQVRKAMEEANCSGLSVYAKIEEQQGIDNLQEILPLCDELVIARGDLGNRYPLWEIPVLQNRIGTICRSAGKPFMVVTQMLASMEKKSIPTRAEVSDIFLAVEQGAASVMVTGETAVGQYPVEVIRYLVKTGEHSKKG